MSQVSSATAKTLKEAGLPQPKPETGQMWYSAFAEMVCVCCYRSDTGERPMLAPIGLIDWSHNHGAGAMQGSKETIFLPDVDYIMDRLPQGTILEFWEGHASASNTSAEKPIRSYGETFAEAAADLWLKLNETPKS